MEESVERRKHELQGRQVLQEPGEVGLLSMDGKEREPFLQRGEDVLPIVRMDTGLKSFDTEGLLQSDGHSSNLAENKNELVRKPEHPWPLKTRARLPWSQRWPFTRLDHHHQLRREISGEAKPEAKPYNLNEARVNLAMDTTNLKRNAVDVSTSNISVIVVGLSTCISSGSEQKQLVSVRQKDCIPIKLGQIILLEIDSGHESSIKLQGKIKSPYHNIVQDKDLVTPNI
ncbi:hypothetical protein E5288_WYG000461 [Bos mutus]|uniref:Uncharacterized protein n=1 Tax=Bos mutus TaxID=72004 RepID=A0A6B0QQD1_9CETA|nr:hypothetical protein [Bos mutus]